MRRRPWFLLTACLALAPGMAGRSAHGDPREGAGVVIRRMCDATRRNDREALQALFASDYRYDGLDARQATNLFDGPLSFRYRALYCRTEALTRVGRTVTALISAIYEGNLNLEFLFRGRPTVQGQASIVLELEPREGAWRITASRLVRSTWVAPGRAAPHLLEVRVNGHTSLAVAPGAELIVTGASFGGARLLAFVGANSISGSTDPDAVTRWRAPLAAPMTPGRYLVHAVAFSQDFLALDRLTLPVVVTAAAR